MKNSLSWVWTVLAGLSMVEERLQLQMKYLIKVQRETINADIMHIDRFWYVRKIVGRPIRTLG